MRKVAFLGVEGRIVDTSSLSYLDISVKRTNSTIGQDRNLLSGP